MLKIVLLVIYLYGGSPAGPELVVERTEFATDTECRIAGGKKMEKLNADPKLVEGLWAGCVPAVSQKA